MKQFKTITLAIVLLSVLNIYAQQKLEKTSQSVIANNDVTINLDTSHTNIEIDTWNKNEVLVEAYIESKDLTKEELKELLDDWKVEVKGSGDNVSITSLGHSRFNWNYNFEFDGVALKALEELQFVMADLPEIPEMPEMPPMPEMPAMPPMPEMPVMPQLPELPEGVHNVNFDFDAYKKDGDKYLDKWSKEYEAKYGKEYKDKMRAWAKEFAKTDFDKYSKEMEAWGKKYGESFGKDYEEKMEAWGKKYGEKFDGEWAKKMEAWGEEFGEKFGKEFEVKMQDRAKLMEERSKAMEDRLKSREEQLGKRMEEREKEMEKRMEEREQRREQLERKMKSLKKGKVIKTIKIRMPKDAKLKVNVRHGELKFASVIYNLKADLSHSTLIATSIDGGLTSINASYSPVMVTKWNLGELKLNYVENAHLNVVNRLTLKSNSSNIVIAELMGNAVINGSFGDLEINKISDAFNNLNMVLENSDAVVTLPKTEYSLQFQGSHSTFKRPDKTMKEKTSNLSLGNLKSNKTIVIDAKYSNIVMQ